MSSNISIGDILTMKHKGGATKNIKLIKIRCNPAGDRPSKADIEWPGAGQITISIKTGKITHSKASTSLWELIPDHLEKLQELASKLHRESTDRMKSNKPGGRG